MKKRATPRSLMTAFILASLISIESTAAPAFKWGFQERLRHTYMNNATDFNADKDDEQAFFRIRTSLWGQLDWSRDLSFRVQLNNEFRYYTIVRQADKDAGKENTLDEVIFEHLYLKYTMPGANPLTFILGRQNLTYGEGFILMDGAPWDGSRTIYHDAVKISYQQNDLTYDLLAISNPRVDHRLPKLKFTEKGGKYLGAPKTYDGDQILNDGLEEALGLYITKKMGASQLETYYFHKIEEPNFALPTFPGITASQKSTLQLNTVGFRVTQPLTNALKLTTEWAVQQGSQGKNDVSAFGGYANLSYTVVPQKKGVLTGGLYVLSGDNPRTAKVEGWNPLFSRWPKWSELYIYSHTAENNGGARKAAYWTNTIAPNVRFDMVLNPTVNLTFWVHHLDAFHPTASGAGTTRGDEVQLWVRFNFNKRLTAHFLADYFMPGDFYAQPRSGAAFIRGELLYTLQ